VKKTFVVIALGLLFGSGISGADDNQKKDKLDHAKQTVNNIRQADPPRASTSTVKTDTAKSIANREKRKEQQRQKETPTKYKTKEVPPLPEKVRGSFQLCA
jgi:hypothetical protein